MNQKQLFEQERKKIAETNALFMEMKSGKDPLTDEELRKLIKKRPNLWGRFKNFLPENRTTMVGRVTCSNGHFNTGD